MRLNRFASYSWAVLVYNLGVILWGAYVRATGSGAGCGRHWPLCNGEVVPIAPRVETLIEFSHRLTSGLALLLVIGLFIWALRAYPRGHDIRLGAGLALLFTISEALVGAGLVLFGLVADNDSAGRAAVVATHLINTFLLLAALAITSYWASGGRPVRLRRSGASAWFLGAGLLGVLTLGITGAITALGDTLFPAASLAAGWQQDISPAAHFLIRLRVIHPVIAVVVGFYVILIARFLDNRSNAADGTRKLATGLTLLVVTQLIAGAINVALLAPVAMQIIHLLLADLLWITLILFSGMVLADTVPHSAEAARHQRLAEAGQRGLG